MFDVVMSALCASSRKATIEVSAAGESWSLSALEK
jgi:hypothetical protein